MTHDPYTTTTIEDDGPRWRTVAILAIAGALIIDAAQIDKRASLAIAEAARIAQETREARVFFWVVVWVSAALVVANASRSLISGPQAHGVAGAAAAVLVILGARAYLALRYAQYAAIEVSNVARAPELLSCFRAALGSRFRPIDSHRLKEGVPDASPGLPGDLRLETRSKSSTIQDYMQDLIGDTLRRRSQEQPNDRGALV